MGRHRLQLTNLFCKSEDRSADHRTGGFSETNGLSKSGWGDTHPSGGKVGNYEANTAKWAVTQLFGLGCLQKIISSETARPTGHGAAP